MEGVKSKPKVLIIGPFKHMGGRELEANQIYHSLKERFDPFVFSTEFYDKGSQAVNGLPENKWTGLNQQLYLNPLIALLTKLKNPRSTKAEAVRHVRSVFVKSVIDIHSKEESIIKRLLNGFDLVICCMQVSSKYLKLIVEICSLNKIPVVLRVTGTVKSSLDNIKWQWLSKLDRVIVHSQLNAQPFDCFSHFSVQRIDQFAICETALLSLEPLAERVKQFGYLGRLEEEKAILPLIKHFPEDPGVGLIIAGSGSQQQEVTEAVKLRSNIRFVGEIKMEDLKEFYKQIQCLIVPSLEESGPLVGVEAMAAARLILSTKVGAMSDRLEGNSNQFWIDWDQVETLSSGIAQLNGLDTNTVRSISDENRSAYLSTLAQTAIQKAYLEMAIDLVK